jgi:hypothetical protein
MVVAVLECHGDRGRWSVGRGGERRGGVVALERRGADAKACLLVDMVGGECTSTYASEENRRIHY